MLRTEFYLPKIHVLESYPSTRLFRDGDFAKVIRVMRPRRKALTRQDWCPCERPQSIPRTHSLTQSLSAPLPGFLLSLSLIPPLQELNQPLPWPCTSQPPGRWEINVCCLSATVYGILLHQHKQTKAVYLLLWQKTWNQKTTKHRALLW